MTYEAEWTPPESYWVIVTTSMTFRVDERTAHRAWDEWERGDRALVFTDLSGGENRMAADGFRGIYESTPAQRAKEAALTKQLDDEGGQFG